MKKLKTEERYSILKEDGLFSLVIYPERNKVKLNLLFAWWMAWTICGVAFIGSYFSYGRAADMMRVYYVKADREVKDVNLREATKAKYIKDIERNEKQRLFLLGIIAFWVYYEYKVGRAYLYRKYGREKLWVKNGVLFFQRQLAGRGKVRKYEAAHIKDVRLTDYNKHDFFQNVSRSFWTLSGESLVFDFHSRYIRFGIQLEEKYAHEICEELKRALKKALSEER